MDTLCPYSPPPRTPHYGGRTPERVQKISGAQNQECLGAIPSGPTGALVGKICFRCSSQIAPGFAEPTLPVRIPAGAPRGSPTQKRKPCRGGGDSPYQEADSPYQGEMAEGQKGVG